MVTTLASLLLINLAPLKEPPFVLTMTDAAIVDKAISLRKCGINKKQLARYYWYEATSEGLGYMINMYKVNFAIFKNLRVGVHPAMIDPMGKNPNSKLVAYGSYDVVSKQSSLSCVGK